MAPPPSLRTRYLALYNAASAIAWAYILFAALRAAAAAAQHGSLYSQVGRYVRWTQTCAALEVLHALFGIVRASPATTLMQVSSRLLLVWPILHNHPAVAYSAASPFYTTMLLAWSAAEVIRYSLFAVTLAAGGSGAAPGFLLWLRYNAFLPLYPVGIGSEYVLIWRTSQPDVVRSEGERLVLYAVLAFYVPGAYILFTHMMAQRRKMMRPEKAKKR